MAGSTKADTAYPDRSIAGLTYGGAGTLRLVNLLLHRFGVFDFLGFDKAPDGDVERYKREVQMGLYPAEIRAAYDTKEKQKDEQMVESMTVLPWTYSPASDPTTCIVLLEELLHLIIIVSTCPWVAHL